MQPKIYVVTVKLNVLEINLIKNVLIKLIKIIRIQESFNRSLICGASHDGYEWVVVSPSSPAVLRQRVARSITNHNSSYVILSS